MACTVVVPMVVALAVAFMTLAANPVESFVLPPTRTAVPAVAALHRGSGRSSMGGGALRMKYVPDGLTPEQWKKMQAKEADKKKKLDLGYVGVKGFKSRSLQAWQEAGSGHLFPVNPKKVCVCGKRNSSRCCSSVTAAVVVVEC